MIQLNSVNFGYKRKQTLFDQLDLEVEAGKIYGLLGRNGAGKSSLLRIIHGLLFPRTGAVKVMGYAPQKRQPGLLSEIYMISEEQFIPNMKIKTFLNTYSPFYPKFDQAQFFRLLEEFELDSNGHLKQLSWGQKKKVLVSFGLATNCKLLLLDEPTNGLDIPSKAQFRQLMSDAITDERAFIISSHQIRDLHSLLDTIVVLEKGKIIFQETMGSIMTHLNFQVEYQRPDEAQLVYAERVPGGYMTIRPNNGLADSLEADLEILFNAIISNTNQIHQLFKNTTTHAE